jgi:hypothetical protein
LKKVSGIWVEIRPRGEVGTGGYPWPEKGEPLPDGLVDDLARYGPAALDFVADRRHLAAVLAEPGSVARGELFSYNIGPGRFVSAVLLARMLGDAAVEQRALDSIRRYVAEKDNPKEAAQWVRHWAKERSAVSEVDLSDLRAYRP